MPAFRLFWRQISALIRKELMALIKDPSARVLLLAPPIMQTMLFGYAATFDIADVPYAVVDLDRSAASGELLARLDGSGLFQREATLASPSQIAPLVDRGDVLLAITIPPISPPSWKRGSPPRCKSFWMAAIRPRRGWPGRTWPRS
ncbi:hypothetical protein ACFSTD_13765 [Novosphingobium colocasiae]